MYVFTVNVCVHVSILLANPVPEDDGNPDPRESWTWSQLLPGILIGILYFLASSPSPIPEISFPYFLQYIVNAGEVRELSKYLGLLVE